MSELQRLDKLLGHMGVGTRSELKKMARGKMITVDGEIVRDAGMKVDPDTQVVCVNGEVIRYRKFVYLMMNKPAGCVSATWDSKMPTVIDHLPEEYRSFEVFPVGRLDIDTVGLLVLTNDGALTHEVLSPKKHVGKTYHATITGGVIGDKAVDLFRRGVDLGDFTTLPASLRMLSTDPDVICEVVIMEGKFHQVKRMFEAIGRKVTYLRRVSMGGLELDETLPEGSVRELTAEELILLKGGIQDDQTDDSEDSAVSAGV